MKVLKFTLWLVVISLVCLFVYYILPLLLVALGLLVLVSRGKAKKAKHRAGVEYVNEETGEVSTKKPVFDEKRSVRFE